MSFLRNTFMNAYKGRLYPNYWDIIALLFVLGLIALLAWQAKQMNAPYELGQTIPISLDPRNLPGYAMRTVLRMLIALFFALLFTFTFGTWAAKSRRAERIIIPFIDILQSIPVLGFLSITIVGFISLFRGSMLGLNVRPFLQFLLRKYGIWRLGFIKQCVLCQQNYVKLLNVSFVCLATFLAHRRCIFDAWFIMEYDVIDVGKLVFRRGIRSDICF